MSTTNWKRWCRLCARIDGGSELKLDTIKTVSDILQKYLQISITSSDDCLSVVCQDCLDLVLNVEKFCLLCTKVNKMFLELSKGIISDNTVDSVRETYFSGSYEYINCEINQLEPKAEPLSEIEFDDPGLNDAVSFVDEDDNQSDNTPDCKKRRIEPVPNRQLKSKKHKQSNKMKSTQSPAKKCKTSTETRPVLTRRIRSNNTDVWCHLCDITFKLPYNYLIHMRRKHSPEVLPFVCAECPKAFASEKNMLLHTACHLPVEKRRIHPCPECDKTFSTVEIMKVHIRLVHIGDRPFFCEICGIACATNAALKEHQITHTDERPYKCNECSKCFKYLRGLKQHSRTHNTMSFECLQCGQRLNTLQTLKNHMLVHSDEKRYKCQHCGNAYKRSKTLKEHLIIHTRIRPYACPFCDVTYANGSNLRAHKKKYHPVEMTTMEATGQVTCELVISNAKHLQPK